MKKKIAWLLSFVAIMLVSIFVTTPETSYAAGASFTISSRTPTTQLDKTVDYFNLLVTPSREDTLTLVVNNLSDTANTVKITPVGAYTNDNGVIAYRHKLTTQETSSKVTFPDLIQQQSISVDLGPKETKEVSFNFKAPAESFKGLIDGGFQAMSANDETTTQAQKGFSIKNKYALTLGATVQMSTDYVSPELKLNQVEPSLVSNATTLLANLENIEPSLFGKMTVDAKVTARGKDKVLHQAKQSNLEMAPLTNFNYRIDWNHEPFQPGQYTLHLVAKSGSKVWKFDRNFTIKRADADRVNKKAVNLKKTNNWWIWILLLILLLIILIIIFIIWKRRKDKKDEEAQAQLDTK